MITPAYITLAIVFMAMITFSVRYVFFTTSFQINLHPNVKSLLVFTAPCILTAMTIPLVFQSSLEPTTLNNGASLLNSSYFWGGLLAIALSLIIRQTLIVIVLSMVGFYSLRYFGLH